MSHQQSTNHTHEQTPYQLCRCQLVHGQVMDSALKPTRECYQHPLFLFYISHTRKTEHRPSDNRQNCDRNAKEQKKNEVKLGYIAVSRSVGPLCP